MLMGKPAPGAADAALHLVDHEQPVLPVANLPQRTHEIIMCKVDAALALNRLEQHRNDVWIARGKLLDRNDIVKRHPHKTRDQRFETGLHLAVAGGRKRRQRAPVKRLFHDDDGGLFDSLLVSVQPSQFDRGFVGLAARIAEEHFVHAGKRSKAIGKRFSFRDSIQVRCMDEPTKLLAQCLHQLRMIVAQRIYGDARQGVQIGLALLVEQPATLAVGEGDR